tara:strand:- start:749 stop:1345 length:597 start_codon:yes stop_codon:yes gene_type:complete
MGGGKLLEEGSALTLDFSKLDKVASKHCDVVPVVVQDTRTSAVLIAAYVNEIALRETFERRVCCLWSTSRNELWVKGATSGDTLDLDDVMINCEQNSLVFKVTPRRKGACHTKDENGNTRVSCYYRRVVPAPDGSLALQHVVDLTAAFCPPCPPATATSAVPATAASPVSPWPSLAAGCAIAVASSLATMVVLAARKR